MIDLEEIKSRINPQYADMPGTDSHERKMLCDEIEALRQKLENMTERYPVSKELADHLSRQLTVAYVDVERLNRTLRHQAEAVTATINRHHEQMAEKDAEIERLKSENRDACVGLNDYFGQQLAAGQAREQQLREYIDAAYKMATESPDNQPFDWAVFCEMLHSALAIPADTSALEAMIAKAGEVMRERIIANLLRCGALGDGDYLNAIRALPAITLDDLKGAQLSAQGVINEN